MSNWWSCPHCGRRLKWHNRADGPSRVTCPNEQCMYAIKYAINYAINVPGPVNTAQQEADS